MKPPFGGENIVANVATPNIPDPRPGTAEYEYAMIRDRSSRSIAEMPWLPQNPDSDEWAKELYDRIIEAERTYIAPNLMYSEYINGTATEPDQIEIVRGRLEQPYLFTAEHATCPVRVKSKTVRSPDAGTGGLAAVIAEDYGTALIMRGQQTTNIPSVEDHPMKKAIRQELPAAIGFTSIHGKNPRAFVYQTDRSEIHACIGLGLEPTEAMRDFARKVVLTARDDLGLYVVVANDQPAYVQELRSTKIKRKPDGTPALSQLAARTPYSTTNFSRQCLNDSGKDKPSLQLELTNLLRATPPEVGKKDKKTQIIGTALGYKLLEKIVELTFVEWENLIDAV